MIWNHFGVNFIKSKIYIVREIPKKVADAIIKKYHYSGKVVPNSNLHIGVFNGEKDLVGCLQFGSPMNPKSTPNSICTDSTSDDMLELNRMVMIDSEPRNSESHAISLCINYLKKFRKDIHYLLSFSDGKEGNVGYIYQASNWLYQGYHLSNSFYNLDGTILHSVQVWHKFKENHFDRDIKTTHEILYDNFDNVSILTAKQHIYVYPLSKKFKFVQKMDYPKKDSEIPILSERYYKRNSVVLDIPELVEFDLSSISTEPHPDRDIQENNLELFFA